MASRPVASGTVRFVPGGGLWIQSQDGDFGLRFQAATLLRYELLNNESEDDDARHGLNVQRARVILGGHFFGPRNQFGIQLGFAPNDVALQQVTPADGATPRTSPLLDWYLRFDHLRDAVLQVGQYAIPHTRERLTPWNRLQLSDWSIVDAEFGLDRDVGLHLGSEDLAGLDLMRYAVGVFSARGRNASLPKNDFGLLYLARAELAPLGSFDSYADADFERLPAAKLSFGGSLAAIDDAALNRGTRGTRPSDGGTTDIVSLTGDVVFKMLGVSARAEVIWREARRNPGDALDSLGRPVAVEPGRDALGWLLQAGYLFPTTRLEAAARAAQVLFEADGGQPDQYEYVLGLNYYFARHPFKLQGEYARIGTQQFTDFGVDNGVDFSSQFRVQLFASF